MHSFGMRESVWVVALDAAGATLGVRLLLPGRVLWWRQATWLLELPATEPPPSEQLTAESWVRQP